jgi:hypothetical protein
MHNAKKKKNKTKQKPTKTPKNQTEILQRFPWRKRRGLAVHSLTRSQAATF